MKKYFFWCLCLCLLSACSKEEQKDNKFYTVKTDSVANTLFYAGTILPLRTVVITSPAEGVIVEMPFQYGQVVAKNQLLFLISSTKFLSDYKAALMTYVKAKSDFNNSQTQLKEAEFLHKNQLISDDDYSTKQSNFYGSQLGLLQAKDALQSLIQQLDIKNIDLYKLSIADIDKITQAMHLQMSSEDLRIISPAPGIILSQIKGEDDNKKVAQGDAVKQGDVLAIIGDMSGLSVRVKVNELTINQLQVGQKVKVTGVAFNDVLNGKIKRIDRQGEGSSGGSPTFSVEVMVPTLTLAQQKQIHVGMSAKVEIDIQDNPQLIIPLTAIVEKNGKSFVEVYDDQTGKTHEVAVDTGKTTLDTVAVLAGLKAGDKILAAP